MAEDGHRYLYCDGRRTPGGQSKGLMWPCSPDDDHWVGGLRDKDHVRTSYFKLKHQDHILTYHAISNVID